VVLGLLLLPATVYAGIVFISVTEVVYRDLGETSGRRSASDQLQVTTVGLSRYAKRRRSGQEPNIRPLREALWWGLCGLLLISRTFTFASVAFWSIGFWDRGREMPDRGFTTNPTAVLPSTLT
jgi:hypothetical protein